MIKKIVTLHGSPRHHSTSSYYSHYFISQLEAPSDDITHFYLAKLSYKGCTACDACQKKVEHCIIKDDLQEVLEAVKACDLLIIASPIYFDGLSSLVQAFLERCQSFYSTNFLHRPDKSRLAPGKKLVVITSQEQKIGHRYEELKSRIAYHFSYFGFSTPLFLAIDQIHPYDNPATKQLFLEHLQKNAKQLLK